MPMYKTGRMMHMGATKDFIRQGIMAHGAQAILKEWAGTDDAALLALADDPREVFCGCDCKKDERGACTGESV